MPFSIIPPVLGTSFVVIWLFIGWMILRDGQREAQRRRDGGMHPAPHRSQAPHRLAA
jgi:hypothetical protein